LAFLNGGKLTNEASGIVGIPGPGAVSIAGIELIPAFDGSSPLPFYYLSALLLAGTLLALWRIMNCRIGWVFRSLRLNEELASSMGVNVAAYRVLAFSLSSFIGGVGGSFYAVYQQNIYPASYTVTDSMNYMLYCFLGGLDYVLGALVGAFTLVLSFELLHALQTYQTLIYAGIMILAMLLLPNGIISFPMFHGGRAASRGGGR
jgi:branched-chain amino acid transport system permease protein